MNPKFLIIHHSLTKDGTAVSWGAIRKYHMDVKKWTDIGYSYGVELVGAHYEILKGRMDNEDGAHCLGFNDNSLSICLVGDFDAWSPPIPQLNLLRKLCRSLIEIYGIKPENVLGHRETYPLRGVPVEKTCPGSSMDMAAFRLTL